MGFDDGRGAGGIAEHEERRKGGGSALRAAGGDAEGEEFADGLTRYVCDSVRNGLSSEIMYDVMY